MQINHFNFAYFFMFFQFLSFRCFMFQVQVDSADNHDRTRKFVWQKSSHIAQVVSQKLASAAQAFLDKPIEI